MPTRRMTTGATPSRTMKLNDAQDLAEELFQTYGLGHWHFKFDRSKRRFGQCRYADETITISAPLTLVNGEAEVRDTILHEIAHAMTPGHCHGPEWKRACLEVGARPLRGYSAADVAKPAAPWYLVCETCGYRAPRYRKTLNRYSHLRCGGLMEWERG